MEAIPTDPNHPSPFDATAKAPDGLVAIDEMEPGDYHVAINVKNSPSGEHSRFAKFGRIWPYPTTYYPGVADRSKAAAFHVERGTTMDIGDWVLPSRLSERPLSGVVLRPDGSPAAGARLVLVRAGDQGWVSEIGPTGPDGHFEVYALETIPYVLKAGYRDKDGKAVYVGSISIDPDAIGPLSVSLAPFQQEQWDEDVFLFY